MNTRRSFIKNASLAIGAAALGLGMLGKPRRYFGEETPPFPKRFYNLEVTSWKSSYVGQYITVDGKRLMITEYDGCTKVGEINPDWVKVPHEEMVIHWGRTKPGSNDLQLK